MPSAGLARGAFSRPFGRRLALRRAPTPRGEAHDSRERPEGPGVEICGFERLTPPEPPGPRQTARVPGGSHPQGPGYPRAGKVTPPWGDLSVCTAPVHISLGSVTPRTLPVKEPPGGPKTPPLWDRSMVLSLYKTRLELSPQGIPLPRAPRAQRAHWGLSSPSEPGVMKPCRSGVSARFWPRSTADRRRSGAAGGGIAHPQTGFYPVWEPKHSTSRPPKRSMPAPRHGGASASGVTWGSSPDLTLAPRMGTPIQPDRGPARTMSC